MSSHLCKINSVKLIFFVQQSLQEMPLYHMQVEIYEGISSFVKIIINALSGMPKSLESTKSNISWIC